jgi:hypothetical protein
VLNGLLDSGVNLPRRWLKKLAAGLPEEEAKTRSGLAELFLARRAQASEVQAICAEAATVAQRRTQNQRAIEASLSALTG